MIEDGECMPITASYPSFEAPFTCRRYAGAHVALGNESSQRTAFQNAIIEIMHHSMSYSSDGSLSKRH